jgi:hypothetical protein
MHLKISKSLALAGAAAALAFPAIALANNGHGNAHVHQHGQSQQPHGHGKAKGQSKPKNYIVKGTVTDVTGDIVTVAVNHANHHGKGLVGQTVQFDLSSGRVVGRAHDTSGVHVGDRVVVQARLPRDLTGTLQPYVARKLVDRGQKQTSQPDQQGQSTTGGDDQSNG